MCADPLLSGHRSAQWLVRRRSSLPSGNSSTQKRFASLPVLRGEDDAPMRSANQRDVPGGDGDGDEKRDGTWNQ